MFDEIHSVTKLPVMKETDEATFLTFVTIGLYFTLLFGIWWFWPNSIPHNFTGLSHIFDYLLFIAISYVVWHQIILELFSWFIASNMKRPMFLPPEKGLSVAFLTAFVPSNEPIAILENTLKAMIEVDYPHDTWVLDEGNSEEVKHVCDKYGVKHFSRHGMSEYNQETGRYKVKTKGGNYNAWFDNYGIQYDLVAQIDVDFIPKKTFSQILSDTSVTLMLPLSVPLRYTVIRKAHGWPVVPQSKPLVSMVICKKGYVVLTCLFLSVLIISSDLLPITISTATQDTSWKIILPV